MSATASIAAQRGQLLGSLFPGGIPRLWCPALAHYDSQGALDRPRIVAHLRKTSAHVKGFLIPGSTGDGWEMNEEEALQWIDIALDSAQEMNFHLLIGALKATLDETLGLINRITTLAKYRALAASRVCGFAVCAPRGEKVSQSEMDRALQAVFETGLPIAFYQLPQVTQNTAGPELVGDWAKRFPNFVLFKDSSGVDAVIQSNNSLDGVFAMRGAEGDYARWLKGRGGPYDGVLLSTANCFAAEYAQMFAAMDVKDLEGAEKLSARLTAVIKEAFDLVNGFPEGNPYANANRAIDHFFAYGPGAAKIGAARLHSGRPLPVEILSRAGDILQRRGFMPASGYL